MPDFTIRLISGEDALAALVQRLEVSPALALDIETVNWWNREAERVALIQLAFREGPRLRVAIIDALADFDLAPLRAPLELSGVTKAVHNAAYDAARLSRHFRIHTSPIHDTMLAARRGGERRYSLQAQAQAHLGIQLDKSEQRGDWGRRPLPIKQLQYAALDAACTLLLYENQIGRGLVGSYRPRERDRSGQNSLPLGEAPTHPAALDDIGEVAEAEAPSAEGLRAPALALLGVVTELSGRYSPERLAASAGGERVGLAGWIIDRAIGPETGIDEETAKLEIAELCERGFIRITVGRRMEATESGALLWQHVKPS
jgi:3'-5' exonuclease